MKTGLAINIDAGLLRELPLVRADGDADKEVRGRVEIVGGSTSAPGAIRLCGLAALRAGAGKIQLAVPESIATALGIALMEAGVVGLPQSDSGELQGTSPELRAVVEQAGAVLIGPGMMNEDAAQEVARFLLSEVIGPVFVVDAMALTGLGDSTELLQRHEGRVVITPHAGEMAALSGRSKEDVATNAEEIASEIAVRLGCIVVLKGSCTYIAQPDGTTHAHSLENAGLATAGSGDVLAGTIAGLAAQGNPALRACIWGVFAHAQAGVQLRSRIGPLGFLASELLAEIPSLLAAPDK